MPLLQFLGMQLVAKPNQYNLWAWWGIFVYWLVAPILECILGKDSANPTSMQISSLEKSHYYKILVIMVIPIQLALLLYGAYVFSSFNTLNLFGRIGWLLSNGLCSANLALVAGHELIHKPNRAEQMMGSFILASVCNTGFRIEHLRGHHVNVGTPLDVYSASLHQSLFDYISRASYHTLVNPWKLEKVRLNRKGYSLWSWRNEQIVGATVSAAMAVIFYSLYGVLGLIFFFTQSVIAWIVLQVINYIQHYGLTRHNRNNGIYERPNAAHAWNSNFWLPNMVLLHLPRHPDHHIHPRRCYQVLRHLDESPQMPFGYFAMSVIALIPPLWFKLIDPLISVYHRSKAYEEGPEGEAREGWA